jgi:hypothetical protein
MKQQNTQYKAKPYPSRATKVFVRADSPDEAAAAGNAIDQVLNDLVSVQMKDESRHKETNDDQRD